MDTFLVLFTELVRRSPGIRITSSPPHQGLGLGTSSIELVPFRTSLTVEA